VLKVIDLTGTQYVQREMALVKVNARADHRAEILRITDIFRGQVVDVGMELFTLKIEGDAEKIEAVLNLLKPYGIREIARTGCVALPRENR
jgi:acetolactate synthase-1/3 small subunit